MYVCICNAITEREVLECARHGARSLDDLVTRLGLGAGCGRCRDCAASLLEDMQRAMEGPATALAVAESRGCK
jgi:bacterioferritin-associated ferredoxin